MAESSVTPTSSHTDSEASKTRGDAFALTLDRDDLDLRLESLDGIGARTADRLRERGVADARDLLTFFPNRYHRTVRHPDAEAMRERPERILVRGVVTSVRRPRPRSNQPLEVIIECGGERLVLVWFHVPGSRFAHGFRTDRWIEVEGAVDWDRGLPRLVHPRTAWVDGPAHEECGVEWEGVYPSVEGLAPRRLAAAIAQAFARLAPHFADRIPGHALHELGPIAPAIAALHVLGDVPEGGWDVAWRRANRRLVYEELFALQRELARMRSELSERARAPRCVDHALAERVRAALPFDLTVEQARTFEELVRELAQPWPMRRLLQGDVGCGKTVVAMLLAAAAVGSGAQVAIMAPTEVLARQLHAEAEKLLRPSGLNVAFLAGSTTPADRRGVLREIGSGEANVVVGTHALYSDDVGFAALGLVIVDEQHKFGVDQRQALLAKGSDPHLLAMSATPIPRSLAHAIFGDLDLAVIRERPHGREPVRTYLRGRQSRAAIYEWLADVLAKGQQAFVVFPAIEDDARGFRALLDGAEELANGWLRGRRLGVLHGQMSTEDKVSIMRRFHAREVDVLCATTVVEVGVDVPNATVMVIESAEAFGLSQLHQLRGRVGRGTEVSRCILVAGDAVPESARERLVAFESTTDGFRLAEMDLELRGPGEFLGARQAGAAQFRFADLTRDADILERARDDARTVVFREASKR